MQRVFDLWKDETSLPSSTSPVYILGEKFTFAENDDMPLTDNPKIEWPADFTAVAKRLVSFMYRTQFTSPIPRDPQGPSPLLQNVNSFFRNGPGVIQTSNLLDAFTSDIGWGCMIRTGQSLLANALVRLKYGRISSLKTKRGVAMGLEAEPSPAAAPDSSVPLDLLREFRDEPEAAYSIHRFVQHGAQHCAKRPGEWFGPSAVAACIAEFAAPHLNTYTFTGMDVYEQQLSGGQFPMLVLCNLRLGISKINPIYYEGLRSLLTSPHSVGIAGGRTSASHFFYGVQDTTLFYHDPHEPKSALTSSSSAEEYETLHSDRVRTLQFTEMDPSMLVGFLLLSPEDLEEWKTHINSVSERERVLNITQLAPPESVNDANIDGESDDELDDVPGLTADKEHESDGFVVCSGNTLESSIEPTEAIEAREPSDESITVIETAKPAIEPIVPILAEYNS